MIGSTKKWRAIFGSSILKRRAVRSYFATNYLEKVCVRTIRYARATVGKRCRRAEGACSLAPSFDPHKLHVSLVDIPDKWVKHADRVGTSTNAGNHVVRKSPRLFNDLQRPKERTWTSLNMGHRYLEGRVRYGGVLFVEVATHMLYKHRSECIGSGFPFSPAKLSLLIPEPW